MLLDDTMTNDSKMYSTPVALTPALPAELLTWTLSFDTRPIILIVCQSRDRFLHSLLQSIPPISQAPHSSSVNNEETPNKPTPDNLFLRHELLVPTIHQVLTSRNIDVVFVHSLSHLRAYLVAFQPSKQKDTRLHQTDRLMSKEQNLLMIYGILELHRDTTEWSAQGLSQTLGTIVETGYHNDLDIMVMEETSHQQGSEDPEADNLNAEDLRKVRRQEALQIWNEEVPVLSGGSGKKVAEGGWSGRKVEVGRILKRWFRFEVGAWNTV